MATAVAKMHVQDQGNDLTGLGWLSTITLSLASLEVDGITKTPRRGSFSGPTRRKSDSAQKPPSSMGTRGGRRRAHSVSGVSPTVEEKCDHDEVTEFLAMVGEVTEESWAQFRKGHGKKHNDKPPYTLECFVALAVKSITKPAANPEELAKYIRGKLPYYAKRSREELMTSVSGTLRRSGHFYEVQQGSNLWTYTATVTPQPSKTGVQRRRSCGKKAPKVETTFKRARSNSLPTLSNLTLNAALLNQFAQQAEQSPIGALGAPASLSESDGATAALLNDTLLLDLPRSNSFSAKSFSGDSAILSDYELDTPETLIPMQYNTGQWSDDTDLGIASSPEQFNPLESDQSWMPTTYLPTTAPYYFPEVHNEETPTTSLFNLHGS